MICKERNPEEHPEKDKFSLAGAEAEKQMAFYLHRAFGDSTEVRVFNDLRLVRQDTEDVVQIDHLVLHRWGLVLIESKSVTSEVRINKNLEWTRLWDGRWTGIASPFQQTKLQAELLGTLLEASAAQLLGRTLGMLQTHFGRCPFDVLVAISNSGVIHRDGVELPEVCKADQVTDKIRALIRQRRDETNSLNLKVGWTKLSDKELENITQFFLRYHYPAHAPKVVAEEPAAYAAPAADEAPSTSPDARYWPPEARADPTALGICPKCTAQGVIVWGKFSYFWKCPSCQGNTAIKEFCPTCRQKLKLRKDKNRFFTRCETCATESLYHEAPAP
jgi:hypothetical protein